LLSARRQPPREVRRDARRRRRLAPHRAAVREQGQGGCPERAMSTAITRIVTLVAGLLVLGAVNYAIYAKERVIRDGDVVFLELAPVDPRSLMQGDYMALRFRLADQIE